MISRILLFLGLVLSFTSMEAQNTSTCKAPEGLFASARDSVASINWQSAGAGSAYMVQWKSVRATDWKTETTTTNTLLLRGLQPCAEFEFRVKTVCSMTESSAYGESKKFKTLGCNTIAPCATPREVKGETGENKAFFKWAATGARAYEVQYQDASNNGAWLTAVVTTNSFTALNLKACTKYFFKVRSICTSLTATTPVIYSEWSSQITVATTGCGNNNTRCEKLRRLSVVSANTGIVVKWDSIRGATYDIQVKNIRENEWRTISGVRTNFYAFTGLASCSVFEVRVRVNCSSTSSSGWSYSMRFLTAGCQPVCVTPRAVKVIIADSIAVVSWAAPQASKFVLQYRLETDANWKSLNVASNIHVLTGLARCKKYVVRVQAVCSSTNSSDFSEIAKFETGGCHNDCVMPRQLAARVVDSLNAAFLVWSGTGARAYIVEFKNFSDATSGWRRDTVTTTALTVKNLLRCTKYGFRVTALCSNAVTAPSETYIFATGGCPEPCAIPKELKADIVEDSIAVMYWSGMAGKYEIQYRLSNATDNDWKSVTVASPAHKLVLHRCAIYIWRVRKICENGMSAWSELGKFETRGCIIPSVCEIPRELKADIVEDSIAVMYWAGTAGKYEIQYRLSNATDNDWKSVTVASPAHKLVLHRCAIYIWRVRKICENGMSAWSELGKFETRGCIVPSVCEIPRELKNAIVSDSIAVIAWRALVGNKFEVQYRLIGSGDIGWKSTFVSTLETKLVLNKCKAYEWRVRKICDTGAGDWSASGKFETGGCGTPSVCPTPMNIKVTMVQDAIGITWSDMMERDTIVVQYASSNDAAYNYVIGTTPNGVLLRGLAACTTYKIRVVRKCPNGGVSIAYETSFKTPGINCLTDGDDGLGVNSLQKRTSIKNIGISPNPGSEYIQVQYDLEEVSEVQIQLLNLQGQIVKQMDGGAQDAGTYMQVLDNLTNINQGMYFLVIRANGKVTTTQKWMKQ